MSVGKTFFKANKIVRSINPQLIICGIYRLNNKIIIKLKDTSGIKRDLSEDIKSIKKEFPKAKVELTE
jgi:hypothetical protein